MSSRTRSSLAETVTTTIESSSFPPILSPHHRGVAGESALLAAIDGARAGRFGAADVLWCGEHGRAEVAIVLEPDVDADRCCELLAVMFLAVADCLGALMPPQTAVYLRWPATVLVNAGDAGRIGLALAEPGEDGTPDWAVVGVRLQLASLADEQAPGQNVDVTSLAEEGGAALSAATLLPAIAAHFLVWLDRWQEHGFAALQMPLFARTEGSDAPALIRHGSRSLVATVVALEEGLRARVAPADGSGACTLPLRDVLGDVREALA